MSADQVVEAPKPRMVGAYTEHDIDADKDVQDLIDNV